MDSLKCVISLVVATGSGCWLLNILLLLMYL